MHPTELTTRYVPGRTPQQTTQSMAGNVTAIAVRLSPGLATTLVRLLSRDGIDCINSYTSEARSACGLPAISVDVADKAEENELRLRGARSQG